MKIRLSINTIILLCTFCAQYAQVPADLSNRIDQILSQDYKVYPIDKQATLNFYKSIDKFFNEGFSLGYSTASIDQGLKEEKFIDLKTDIRIVDNKIIENKSTELAAPIRLNYIVGPFERQFIKEYRKPVEKELQKDEVLSISQNFITSYKMLPELQVDKASQSNVYVRRIDMYNEASKKVEKRVVLQRVITERKINEIPVLNSKIIVDIHPESKEILAFKTILWSPVDEVAATKKSYKSRNKILEEINTAINLRNIRITDVGAYYMQMEYLLVPVLKIDYKSADENIITAGSEERSMVIIIPEDPGLNRKERTTRNPVKSE